MRDKTIRTFGATVVLAFIAVAAVAQRMPDQETVEVGTHPSNGQPVPTTAGGDSTTTSTTILQPFVYRVGILSAVTTDNFWAFYGESPSVWDAYILGPTKPALYTLDLSTGAVIPELAVGEPTAEEVDGFWRVVVELDSGFAWSDGRPVTADDVAFTFDTVRRLDLGGAWAESYPVEVARVTALSPAEVLIEFTDRPTLRIWPHSAGMAPVMPKHVWAGLVDDLDAASLYSLEGGQDVGGGPLTLDSVAPEVVVSLRNPGYAVGTAPDVVEYHVFENETAAVGALRDGWIDTVLSPSGLTEQHIAEFGPDDPIEVVSSPANGIRYLGFNLQRAPMSDHAFRNAVALLLDRNSLPSVGPVADSYVGPANIAWFDPERAADIATRYQGNLADRMEGALSGLRDAGYTWDTEPAVSGETVVPGIGLRINGQEPAILTILTSGDAYDPSRPIHAARVADVLGWLGFDARPVETDFDTVVDLAFTPGTDGARHYDMYLLGWTLGNPALPDFYRTFFATDSAGNNTGYASARFMEQLSQYQGAFTVEQAREAMWAMEQILSEDLPYLLLHTTSITEVYRSDRVAFGIESALGGLQARLGGIGDITPVPPPAAGTLGG